MTAPYSNQGLDAGNSGFFKLFLLTRAKSVPVQILTKLGGSYAAAFWPIQFPSAAPKNFPPMIVTSKHWPSPLHQHYNIHARISVEMFAQGTLNSNGGVARELSLLTAKPNKPGEKLS